jgi:hypothetical protein
MREIGSLRSNHISKASTANDPVAAPKALGKRSA